MLVLPVFAVQVCMALLGAGVADGFGSLKFGKRVQYGNVAMWPPSKSDVDSTRWVFAQRFWIGRGSTTRGVVKLHL